MDLLWFMQLFKRGKVTEEAIVSKWVEESHRGRMKSKRKEEKEGKKKKEDETVFRL